MTKEQLDNWFMYHAPTEAQLAKYAEIRAKARQLADVLCDVTLDEEDDVKYLEASQFKSWLRTEVLAGVEYSWCLGALSHLEDAIIEQDDPEYCIGLLRQVVMWANAAVACAKEGE